VVFGVLPILGGVGLHQLVYYIPWNVASSISLLYLICVCLSYSFLFKALGKQAIRLKKGTYFSLGIPTLTFWFIKFVMLELKGLLFFSFSTDPKNLWCDCNDLFDVSFCKGAHESHVLFVRTLPDVDGLGGGGGLCQ
jgi:hypothetical protein